jgi:RNA polymerase sigma-70 factor (ECF subfamily)
MTAGTFGDNALRVDYNFGMTNSPSNEDFKTTHWSLVVSSKEQDSDIRRDSLGELCQAYWYPLFAYLRRKGYAPEAAADYVQGFFVDLIDKDFLDAVSPEKGRFRWFLMSAIKRFVANETEKQSAQKRGGNRKFFSLDVDDAEKRYQLEPVDGWTAEKLFDRRWALAVLQQALETLRSEQEARGKLELYLALQPTLSGIPMTSEQYTEIGDRFGMLAGAVKVAALRLRQKYRDTIRDIVAQTVDESNRVGDELDELLAALRG